jgi:hypothetical protein
MNLFITLLENVNKSRTSANNVSLRVGLGRVVRKIPKITGSNPSGGSELTFGSDLLLTARSSST